MVGMFAIRVMSLFVSIQTIWFSALLGITLVIWCKDAGLSLVGETHLQNIRKRKLGELGL